MLWVYLSALVLALGLLLVPGGQVHDVDGSHTELDLDLGPLLGALASLRFWVFWALGFGLCGLGLTLLQTAGPLLVALVAVAAGLGSGAFVRAVFRRLAGARHQATDLSLAVGKVGRVLVPWRRGAWQGGCIGGVTCTRGRSVQRALLHGAAPGAGAIPPTPARRR